MPAQEEHDEEEIKEAAEGVLPDNLGTLMPQELLALWAHKTYGWSEQNHGLYIESPRLYNLTVRYFILQSETHARMNQALDVSNDHHRAGAVEDFVDCTVQHPPSAVVPSLP